MPYPEFWFWLKLFLSTLFTGLLAWFSYKNESTNKHRTAILAIAIFIVFLSFWNSCDEHYKAQVAEAKSKHDSIVADTYRRRAENLAITNLSASYDIKDSLIDASKKAIKVLNNTETVISQQKSAGVLLSNQVKQSKLIGQNIIKSGTKILTLLDTAQHSIEDNITGGKRYLKIGFYRVGKKAFGLYGQNKFANPIPNVVIDVINYSEIEKCKKIFKNNDLTIDADCYISNHYSTQEYYGSNVYHVLDPNTYRLIDLSGASGKLLIKIQTPRFIFFEEIFYQVMDDQNITSNYRILKVTDVAKKTFIDIESDHMIKDNIWDKLFPITPLFAYEKLN